MSSCFTMIFMAIIFRGLLYWAFAWVSVYRVVALFTFAMVMAAILESKCIKLMGTWTPKWLRQK